MSAVPRVMLLTCAGILRLSFSHAEGARCDAQCRAAYELASIRADFPFFDDGLLLIGWNEFGLAPESRSAAPYSAMT